MLEMFRRDCDPKESNSYRYTICPICGCLTLNGYYVCDICGWEYDGTVMEKEKSIFNNNLTVKRYRKKFLCGCSNEIQKAYISLIRKTKNKYWLFDPSFIINRPKNYIEFYRNKFIDAPTIEWVRTTMGLNV